LAEITVTVDWSRGSDAFLDNRYSRVHRWRFDGGSEVAASSSPHIVAVPMSDPSAIDPEEAFVVSLSSCHMLWFLSIAARRGLLVNRYIDRAVGEMGKREDGKLVMTTVRLRPEIDWGGSIPSAETVAEIHHQAHEECFIANSVRTKISIEPVL
jgi:organic hydroperoxide reductase OsmC/OhrA